VKLLLDENLSPLLVEALDDLYPCSRHVSTVGLGSAGDNEIWAYARANEFVIVSKDSDFMHRSALKNRPPKVILMRVGNCSTNDAEQLLRSRHVSIRQFIEESQETCLVLERPRGMFVLK
jgi:predicted nuclease of predicted toxin-antitoxin system